MSVSLYPTLTLYVAMQVASPDAGTPVGDPIDITPTRKRLSGSDEPIYGPDGEYRWPGELFDKNTLPPDPFADPFQLKFFA